MENVLAALGMKPEQTEDEAVVAIKAKDDAIKAKDEKIGELEEVQTALAKCQTEIKKYKSAEGSTEEIDGLREFQAKTLEVCGLTDTDGHDKVLAYVTGLKVQRPEADKLLAMEKELTTLKAFQEETRIKDLLATYEDRINEGNREDIEKLARSVPEELFASTMNSLPKLVGGPATVPAPTPADAPVLTDDDEEYLASHGIEKGSDRYKAYEDQKRADLKK